MPGCLKARMRGFGIVIVEYEQINVPRPCMIQTASLEKRKTGMIAMHTELGTVFIFLMVYSETVIQR